MTEFVYGRRPVYEALRAGQRSMHKLWLAEGTGGGIVEDILRLARERGVAMEWIPRARLDRMAPAAFGEPRRGRGHHQGLVAQVSAVAYQELEGFLKGLMPH